MDLQLDHKKVEKTEQLFPRQSQLDDHALLTFVINREMAMKENAAVVLQVCARDSLAARTIGVERSGPQNDIVAVEGAIALANGHGGLPGVVPDGGEAIRFGIEAGDSGASALGSVGLKKVKSDCRNLPSWIMYCLQEPFVTFGAPFCGKNDLTTSQSPTNCASSF